MLTLKCLKFVLEWMILNLKTWLCDRFVAIIFSIFFRTRNCRLKLQPKYIRKELCVFFLFPMSINFDFFSVAIEPWIMFRFSGGSDIMKCRIICTLQSFFHWLQKKVEKRQQPASRSTNYYKRFSFYFLHFGFNKVRGPFWKGGQIEGSKIELFEFALSLSKRCSLNGFTYNRLTVELSLKLSSFYAKEHHLYQFIRKTLTRTVKARRNILVYDMKRFGWGA